MAGVALDGPTWHMRPAMRTRVSSGEPGWFVSWRPDRVYGVDGPRRRPTATDHDRNPDLDPAT